MINYDYDVIPSHNSKGLQSSSVILIIFIIVLLFGLFYYLNKSDDMPVHNEGAIWESRAQKKSPPRPPVRRAVSQYKRGDYDAVVNDLVTKVAKNKTFSPSDPLASNQGKFTGYVKKKQIDMTRMDDPFGSDECNEFVYKKKKYKKRTPQETLDLFDVDKVLPQERRDDWFDDEPLMHNTKKIKGSNLIHSKVHMGVNTVGSSRRNGSLDYRGDIPNPKSFVSPWNMSTIDPSMNIKGICSSN